MIQEAKTPLTDQTLLINSLYPDPIISLDTIITDRPDIRTLCGTNSIKLLAILGTLKAKDSEHKHQLQIHQFNN